MIYICRYVLTEGRIIYVAKRILFHVHGWKIQLKPDVLMLVYSGVWISYLTSQLKLSRSGAELFHLLQSREYCSFAKQMTN